MYIRHSCGFAHQRQRHRYCVGGSNMTGYWAKALSAFILSVFLVHSGVAWALKSCLNDGSALHSHDGHASHKALGNTNTFLDPERVPGGKFPASERVHCASLYETNLTAAIAAIFRLTRAPDKAFPNADVSRGRISLTREHAAIRSFSETCNPSESVFLSFHFTSVLRI